MWQGHRLILAISIAFVLSVLHVSSVRAETVDRALNTLSDLNDQTIKAANLVNQIYETGLPRIYAKTQRIVELSNLDSVGSDVLEQLTRDALGDSSLIADLQLKQLDNLVGMMRASQTNFVNQVKELQTKRSLGQRRANKVLRRSTDISFLVDQLEFQVDTSGSKLESIDTLLSNVATSLSGSSGDDSIEDLPRLFSIVRLALKDRLSIRETLRNLTKLIVQNSQDLREAQRLARRVGRPVSAFLMAKFLSSDGSWMEFRVLNLQGRVQLNRSFAKSMEDATALATKDLADGVYLYEFTVFDTNGNVREKTLRAGIVRHRD
jgi:hypothetical protein